MFENYDFGEAASVITPADTGGGWLSSLGGFIDQATPAISSIASIFSGKSPTPVPAVSPHYVSSGGGVSGGGLDTTTLLIIGGIALAAVLLFFKKKR